MTNTASSEERDNEAIARRAYELYEANGREDGHHEEHWRQAEEELYPKGRALEASQQPGGRNQAE